MKREIDLTPGIDSFFSELLRRTRKKKFYLFYALIVLYLSIPGIQIPALEVSNVRLSGVMEQRMMENFFIYYPGQSWSSYSDIPDYLKSGIVGMEDGLFPEHKGVDWDAIYESQRANNRRGKISRGGSTITMQLAKNIYFTTRRTYFRKAKEILTAMRLEKEISKKRLLEQYLNTIELGKGVFGFGTAASTFYNKDVSKLTRDEAAKIIAIVPSPIKHSPLDNSRYVMNRKSTILGRMGDIIVQ